MTDKTLLKADSTSLQLAARSQDFVGHRGPLLRA